jgi:hypothetical protein
MRFSREATAALHAGRHEGLPADAAAAIARVAAGLP